MAEKKKVVVILTPGFPKNEQDSTCLPFLQQYVLTISEMRPDIELRVIAFQYPIKKGLYKWNGIDIYSAGGQSALYTRLFTWRHVLRELNRINGQNEIAVIHSLWLTECTFIAQFFARVKRVNLIAYAIGQDVLRLLNLSKMKVVAMSENIKSRFYQLTGKQVSNVIPAGIDIDKVIMPNEPKTIDILGVGALTSLKNYSLFIEIIAALRKDFPQIRAAIIGKGEQEQLLREKIAEENLNNNIELIGELPHNQVFSFMNRSKIFLHTSSFEGQSTVIMESLAMGLPVICFDVGRMHADKITICEDKNTMIEKVGALLSSEPDHKALVLYTMTDTVKEFIKLYEL